MSVTGDSHPNFTRGSPVSGAPPHHTLRGGLPAFLNFHGIYFVILKYFTIKLRLADDAIKWQKIGDKPPHPSYISSVAKKHQKPFSSRRRRDKIHHIRTTRKEIIELRKIEDELDTGMIKKFNIPLRSKKAERFEKLLYFARSHSFVTRGSVTELQ